MRRPEWKDYRAFCIQTMTTDRDAEYHKETPGFLSGPALRAHFVDHPRWGVKARLEDDPALLQVLRRFLRIPHGWKMEVVLSDPTMVCQCLQAGGHNVIHWRRFVDLWGPRGPLVIPNEEWREDAEFVAWLKKEVPE